ncbi:hypothetical protein [Nocardioides caldifontis]|uniref:hypothetical protein n=1 Tax=Nocardioides caldifontis TaxID=2588938 RepID=UPI00193A3C93|nr:hypothetical protein [Nocardioides caldifontis]
MAREIAVLTNPTAGKGRALHATAVDDAARYFGVPRKDPDNLATLAELRVFRPIPYVLGLDGNSKSVDAVLVAVGNGPSFGGGLRITEGARLDDGLLDVVVFHEVGKGDLLPAYPKLLSGTHTSHPAYEHHRVREVTVAAPGIVAYADGERLGPLPATVTAEPAALRVLVADDPDLRGAP